MVIKADCTECQEENEPHDNNANQSATEDLRFRPDYTFDSFVIGESNRLAFSAALSVATNPSGKYNPLYIYGGSGCGKTHLLHAIGRYIHYHHPEKNIIMVTAEDLVDEFIEAITKKNLNTNWMHEKYRNCDVLLIDDAEMIIGKTATTEFLLYTFNHLVTCSKQIVITADRPAGKPDLTDRLTSRFLSGLSVEIHKPSRELRFEILRQSVKPLEIAFDKRTLNYIARRTTPDLREMRGVVTRIAFCAELEGVTSIDVTFVRGVAEDLLTPSEGWRRRRQQ